MQRLVLFDIDETMIHSYGVGRRALESAMAKLFERPVDTTGHSMSGKTDPQICYEVLLSNGIEREEIAKKLDELLEIYVPILAAEIEQAKHEFKLHVGVVDLIDALEKESWAHLGLLTGNIERGARLKLKPFCLDQRFKIGAFGCDSHNRMDLPSFANKRANHFFEKQFSPAEIVIIGDAVNDVLCAKGYGAKSLAVNTGRTTREELAQLDPDYLFCDLAQTVNVMEAIAAPKNGRH